MNLTAAQALIERVGVLTTPCDLDLFLFFARHPRSLLSSESLASFLGYELGVIAQSLEVLLAARLIERRQGGAHAARMYEFSNHGGAGRWLPTLLKSAATRSGRLALRRALSARAAGAGGGTATSRPEPSEGSSAGRVIRLHPRPSRTARRKSSSERTG